MRKIDEISRQLEEIQRMSARGGCHGPGLLLLSPPKLEAGLSRLGRLLWHVREYWRPKSKEEYLAIHFAKRQED
jgi:hypothetical protein